MKKRAILIGAIVLLFCIIGVIYFVFGQKPTINQDGNLSERSKEYIERRKESNDDAQWRSVNFEKTRMSEDELNNQIVSIDDCYRIKVPFGVTKEEERGPCTYALFLQPSGLLVISYAKSSAENVDMVPGVQMRRQKTSEYKESSSSNGDIIFTGFKRIASEYESSVFALVNGNLLTISLVVPSNEDLDGKFEAIIKGLELL